MEEIEITEAMEKFLEARGNDVNNLNPDDPVDAFEVALAQSMCEERKMNQELSAYIQAHAQVYEIKKLYSKIEAQYLAIKEKYETAKSELFAAKKTLDGAVAKDIFNDTEEKEIPTCPPEPPPPFYIDPADFLMKTAPAIEPSTPKKHIEDLYYSKPSTPKKMGRPPSKKTEPQKPTKKNQLNHDEAATWKREFAEYTQEHVKEIAKITNIQPETLLQIFRRDGLPSKKNYDKISKYIIRKREVLKIK